MSFSTQAGDSTGQIRPFQASSPPPARGHLAPTPAAYEDLRAAYLQLAQRVTTLEAQVELLRRLDTAAAPGASPAPARGGWARFLAGLQACWREWTR